ncbi:MAG: hypothetical protein E7C94_02475 [Finegoldia magna]|uniref:hypothetical protein n=1 Tax=Finegoldia magna TaxID=1260 RepID=UPI002900FB09|nr:hypothetical protein [Finegoldia magna]MDU2574775.1 hypothetical protein [Finegoldia magna]
MIKLTDKEYNEVLERFYPKISHIMANRIKKEIKESMNDREYNTFDDLREVVNFVRNEISVDLYSYMLDIIDELELQYE